MAVKAQTAGRAPRDPRLAAVLAAAILLLEAEGAGPARLRVREAWPPVSPWRYLGRW
ncbi:protein of unknown function [Candidatus Hydrogenisulfobacillus filiaventi]|uniref:Uncharacterized protein n=1 Tax=Candidatus Hydrogenisulfobacillus filiaventi TaxID=2707344 RepID=A0A6F8ZF73_9FIRM|nr:hypothetical protein [Bacillota bacterium]CAB1128427.1 protein of unknown function [Candidatus Hydrogenisulfobacillus filiaventi]